MSELDKNLAASDTDTLEKSESSEADEPGKKPANASDQAAEQPSDIEEEPAAQRPVSPDAMRAAFLVIEAYQTAENADHNLFDDKMRQKLETEHVIEVFMDPEDHMEELELYARLINAPEAGVSEERRKNYYAYLESAARAGHLADASALMPPAMEDMLAKDIIDFYHDYDPYDFAMSQDGWFDGAGQPSEDYEAKLSNEIAEGDDNLDAFFMSLMFITSFTDTDPDLKARAKNLINRLQEYRGNPVPETVDVIVAKPGTSAEWHNIENSTAGIQSALESSHSKEFSFGNGVYMSYLEKTAAQQSNADKNRYLTTRDGKIKGILKGTAVFYAKDKFGNLKALSDEQLSFIADKYWDPVDWSSPLTVSRQKEILYALMNHVAEEEHGKDILRSLGIKDGEVETVLNGHTSKPLDENEIRPDLASKSRTVQPKAEPAESKKQYSDPAVQKAEVASTQPDNVFKPSMQKTEPVSSQSDAVLQQSGSQPASHPIQASDQQNVGDTAGQHASSESVESDNSRLAELLKGFHF